MSGPLFEQYKAALRRGHLAALGGSLDDALEAYREAARLVPERALPFASQATVLHRLDRWPEAVEAFEQALRLAPDDEATLRARASALEARGLRSEAAADYERLAFVHDIAGRGVAAAEAARRAAGLDASPARTALVTRLASAASGSLEPGRPATGEGGLAADEPPLPDEVLGAPAAPVAPDALAPGSQAIDATPAPVSGPGADADVVGNGEAGSERVAWPPSDLPSPPPPPIVGPPPDPEALMAAAADALDAGDLRTARDLMLTAAMVHRTAGHLDAALDACFQLVAAAPGDPQAHLAIANLQLDHGWSGLATEKLDLLVRLTSLTGDTQAEADAHGLAAERLRDAPVPSASAR